MRIVEILYKKYTEFIRWLTFNAMVLVMSPRRLDIFLEISVSLLIFKGTTDDSVEIDLNKFFKLINENYSSDTVGFPNITLDIMWNNEFLNTVQHCKEGNYRIRDLIVSKDLLMSNLDHYIENTLSALPLLVRLKLKLSKKGRYAEIKHQLKKTIQHDHQSHHA